MPKSLSAFAAVVVVAVASLGISGSANAATTNGEYVALGDSYASGVGAYPYDAASGDCKRSPNSYPRTWANNHPTVAFKDMTCSGATITDVRTKQMSALSAKTTLVSITVGGNDDGFTNTVTACLTGTDAECKYATDLGAYYARTKLTDDLAAFYTDVKKQAPNAQILVLGYPRLVDEGTRSCGALSPSAANRKQLTHNADHVAAGIQTASQRAGVKFIEMRLPFLGHEACSADPRINGVDAAHISEIFHPNHYGYTVVYTFMLTAHANQR